VSRGFWVFFRVYSVALGRREARPERPRLDARRDPGRRTAFMIGMITFDSFTFTKVTLVLFIQLGRQGCFGVR